MANNRKKTSDKKRTGNGFSKRMQKKLLVLFLLILVAFAGLSARLAQINRYDGNKYKKQVLSQQQYDSKTIPYKRGDILDSKGTSLAVSEKVYSVILDTKALLRKEEYLEPTLSALKQEFGIDESAVRAYINSNPTSQYYVLKKQCSYDDISGFLELQNDTQNNPNIQGVWFDESYVRKYPNSTLACDVIGFTNGDNNGMFGLEEYYDDILNGTPGREYGYLNDDSTLERTTIAAVDGYTIVSTIDANVQRIVEKYMKEFSEAHRDEVREGPGAENIGCIIMDVHSGEILAMASYPDFDLNDPYNLSEWYTDEEVQQMKDDDTYYSTLNGIWRNFCISDTYEPGSTFKIITAAAGLEERVVTTESTFSCPGFIIVDDRKIRCHKIGGHGTQTFVQCMQNSCNPALISVGLRLGVDNYYKYFEQFGLKKRTGIDLPGEAATIMHKKEDMGNVELATVAFGQSFQITAIQLLTTASSIINGGNRVTPHLGMEALNRDGEVEQVFTYPVETGIVSEETSATMRYILETVVSEGSGRNGQVQGFRVGGKTATSQTLPRGSGRYISSFIGFAPADDPEVIAIAIINNPQGVYYGGQVAAPIIRQLYENILPYLGIEKTF